MLQTWGGEGIQPVFYDNCKWSITFKDRESLHCTLVTCTVYICTHMCMCVRRKLLQSCATLCDPMDCRLSPGSSVHGILQARILEWVAISSSRETSQHRDSTCAAYVSYVGKWVLYH